MWDHSEQTQILPVEFCRDDDHIWDLPSAQTQGEYKEENFWSWYRGDTLLKIPISIIDRLPQNGSIARDVLAFLSQKFLVQKDHYPILQVSFRSIANGIGTSFNGERAKEIENALYYLSFLRLFGNFYMVQSKRIKRKITYGFLDWISRIDEIDGKKVRFNRIVTTLKLNDIYAANLSSHQIPKAPIPVAALEVANKSPPRYIGPVKNLIYRFAALVPRFTSHKYKLTTLAEIAGFKTVRPDRLRKSIESSLEILYPIMLQNYTYLPDEDVYQIVLAGRRCGE